MSQITLLLLVEALLAVWATIATLRWRYWRNEAKIAQGAARVWARALMMFKPLPVAEFLREPPLQCGTPLLQAEEERDRLLREAEEARQAALDQRRADDKIIPFPPRKPEGPKPL